VLGHSLALEHSPTWHTADVGEEGVDDKMQAKAAEKTFMFTWSYLSFVHGAGDPSLARKFQLGL
jgi:hypothetical protein